MKLRIVTWNINSVRKRIDLLAEVAGETKADVICLQEIKCTTDQFPRAAVADLGFKHQHVNGFKGYNGVAILSRRPFIETGAHDLCERADGRHAQATLELGKAGRFELHNYYVPAGGDEPDPEKNEKFGHKLRFLTEMANWWTARPRAGTDAVLVGDLNIAPLESDVWSHTQLLKVVSHTPIEIEHLERVRASQDWADAVRHFVPPEEKTYSWWSYRARDWDTSDRGRRLDHVWVTPRLVDHLASATILREARGWNTPSDHVPIVVDFKG